MPPTYPNSYAPLSSVSFPPKCRSVPCAAFQLHLPTKMAVNASPMHLYPVYPSTLPPAQHLPAELQGRNYAIASHPVHLKANFIPSQTQSYTQSSSRLLPGGLLMQPHAKRGGRFGPQCLRLSLLFHMSSWVIPTVIPAHHSYAPPIHVDCIFFQCVFLVLWPKRPSEGLDATTGC